MFYKSLLCCVAAVAQLCAVSPWDDLSKWSGPKENAEVRQQDGSVTFQRNGGKGFFQLVSPQWIPAASRQFRQIVVEGTFGAFDSKSAQLVLVGYDAAGSMKLWKVIRNYDQNTAPAPERFVVLLAPEITKLVLSARINTPTGTLTLAGVKAEIKPISPPEPGMELLRGNWLGTRNGKLPAGWKVKFWPGLETTFKVTPSSNGVVLLHQAGGARFGIEAETEWSELPPGTVVRFDARYRTGGNGKAAMMAEFFNAAGKAVGEELSASAISGSWSKMHCDFEVPASAKTAKFYLLNVGNGEVTFLEASLAVISKANREVKFPISFYASPVEGNRIIHNGEARLNSIADSPASFSVDFWGERQGLKNPKFVIETAKGLKVAGAYSSHPTVYRAEKPVVTEIMKDGKPFLRHTFTNPAAFSIMEPARRWCRQVVVAFEPENAGITQAVDFPVFYYVGDDNSAGTPRKMVVRVLPPLRKLANPKHFRIIPWGDHDFNFPDPALFVRAIAKYEEIGQNSRQKNSKPELVQLDEMLRARGWKFHHPMQDYTQKRIVGSLVDRLPDKRYAIEANGQTSTHNICPEYYCDSTLFRDKLQKSFRNMMARQDARAGDWVLLDYEPWAAMDSCFCPVCLKKFHATLKDGAKPSVAEIRGKYGKEWAAYRCDQTARINRLTVELLKKINPEFVVVDYDYPVPFHQPGFEKMFQSVAKDPRTYADCVEAHLSSFYHTMRKAAFELIDVNVRTLKRPVWMTPSLSRNDLFQGGYTTDDETLSPRRFRQMILAGATAGTAGLCIYPGHQIDGMFFVEINRAMYEIATFEELFRSGKRVESEWRIQMLPNRVFQLDGGKSELPNWKEFGAFRAHRGEGRDLLSVFNFNGREDLYFRIGMKDDRKGDFSVCDPTTGKFFTREGKKSFSAAELNKLIFRVAPEDVVFLVVLPAEKASPAGSAFPVESTEKDYATLRAASGPGFQALENGGGRLTMTDLDRDGRPELTMTAPGRRVSIGLCGGTLQSWQENRTELIAVSGDLNMRGMLWDYLLKPLTKYSPADANYTLVKAEKVKDGFAVTLKYTFDSRKIELTKKLSIPVAKKEVGVEYSLRNVGTENGEFSFWSHNFPAPGAPADGLTALTFRLGSLTIPEQPAEQIYTVGNAAPVHFRSATGKTEATSVSIVNAASERGIEISAAPGTWNQFYFWRSSKPTAEMMTAVKKLAPGEEMKLSFLCRTVEK